MEKAGSKGNIRGYNYNGGEAFYIGVSTRPSDDEHREKPWQRLPCAFLLIVLGVYMLLGYFAQLIEDELPNPVKEADIAIDDTTTFSEEEAWRYILTILGDQPRVAGLPYHYQKTVDLKALVDSIAARSNIPVETDWQLVTGDYRLGFGMPLTNVYQNASNIIAVLKGRTVGNALLLNCHYDSVPYALGVSDNTIFCGVMAEVLSKLSKRTQPLTHDVVFLFNGAEENPLQGSHGFLSHRWSRNLSNVINMDAAGMNGKPSVFQVTDPRLLRSYKRTVKRPSAQSVGEFLFSSGIIPSDTDFRVFRDYANISGIDIAFTKWAAVYHTRYDNPSLVQAGVVQNAGDMLLPLVTAVADDDQLEQRIAPTAAVYYDYLNWFMVTYSYRAAIAADFFIAVFGLISVAYFVWLVGPRWSTVSDLLYCVLGRFAAMAAGMVVCAILVPLQIATTIQLRYLSEMWLVVPLYWLPYIVTAIGVSQAYDAWRVKKSGINRSIRTLQAQAATRLIFSVILLVLTCVPSVVTIRYVFCVPLFIMSLFSLVSLTVVRYFRLKAWQQLLMEILFSLPTTLWLFALAIRLCAILLPIMGRNGSSNPDWTVALVSVGFAALLSCSISGIELLFSRKRLWIAIAPVALTCFILMFVPFEPYRDDGPVVQRHYWFHSEIISYDYSGVETDRVSGVLVAKYDAYNVDRVLPALQEKGITLNSRKNFEGDCQKFVYCNLPLFRVAAGSYLKDGLFLYTGPPTPFESTLRATRNCVGEICTLSFVMNGPTHNLITLHPRTNANLTSWSLAAPALPSFQLQMRPVYLIVHSVATWSDPLPSFTFDVTFTVPLALQNQAIVDISHHAHKIHHPDEFTAEYRRLLNATPKYFNIASYLSFRKNYLF